MPSRTLSSATSRPASRSDPNGSERRTRPRLPGGVFLFVGGILRARTPRRGRGLEKTSERGRNRSGRLRIERGTNAFSRRRALPGRPLQALRRAPVVDVDLVMVVTESPRARDARLLLVRFRFAASGTDSACAESSITASSKPGDGVVGNLRDRAEAMSVEVLRRPRLWEAADSGSFLGQ